MDIVIIISLIIAGIILFLVEIFIIPGISIAGVAALTCFIYANYYAFVNMGDTVGYITLGVSLISCVAVLTWFIKSKALDKVALKKNITSRVDNKAELTVKIGDTGIATTRLALIGIANINNALVEVKSAEGLINEGSHIIVSRIDEGVINVILQH